MKFGVREICDVVLRAKHKMKLGTYEYSKDMPVLYFDSLKTSSLEGAATTVYAQGGRGNSRLIAWEGEKTITFTMEDALISKESLAILSGAGLVEATNNNIIPVHTVEKVTMESNTEFYLSAKPWDDNVITTTENGTTTQSAGGFGNINTYIIKLDDNGDIIGKPYLIDLSSVTEVTSGGSSQWKCTLNGLSSAAAIGKDDYVLIDYYVQKTSGVSEIQITADKFAGNYYLEASTLFRNKNGEDLPAEFIIPNCKIQSNFTLSMAPTGDPSTFTFTMDAFPDYTKYNRKTKVLAAIQIIEESSFANETITPDATYSTTNETPSSGSRFKKSNSILNNED